MISVISPTILIFLYHLAKGMSQCGKMYYGLCCIQEKGVRATGRGQGWEKYNYVEA